MQKIIFLLLCCSALSASAQEKKVIQLLNDIWKKQNSYQYKSSSFDGDTLQIVQPFTITADKHLQVTYKQYNTGIEKWVTVFQSVPLQKIATVDKDIAIILRTGDEDLVDITTTTRDEKGGAVVTKNKSQLFLVVVYSQPNNDSFGKKLVNAFVKAGYDISTEFWAD